MCVGERVIVHIEYRVSVGSVSTTKESWCVFTKESYLIRAVLDKQRASMSSGLFY